MFRLAFGDRAALVQGFKHVRIPFVYHHFDAWARRNISGKGDAGKYQDCSRLAHVVFALAVLASLSRTSHVATAADVTSTWSAASSGNWNVNANWSNAPALGGFPNNGSAGVSTYDAVINPVGTPYTVTLSTDITVEDLQLSSANATLSHTSGMLTATGAITLSAGTYQLIGGTISGTTMNVAGGTLTAAANSNNLLSGVTINGDLTLNTVNARTKLASGTTFTTAHLAEQNAGLGLAPGQTLSSAIQFEGASNARYVEMNGSAGTFTVGPTGVIRTAAGLGGNAQIGANFWYGGAMALTNQGLISSQTSGRTVTVNPVSLANSGTGILEATGGGILTIDATNWSNAGNLRALTGSTVNLNNAWSNLGGTITADATSTLNFGGSFSTPNLGTLSLAAGSKVNILGTWDNSGQSFTLNNATGSWTLAGGTLSGGTLAFADGKTLIIGANSSNLLSGVTVNGDLNLSTIDARMKLAGGTTFNTAHLAGSASSLGVAPGYTLASTILFEGASFAPRAVEMNGTAGTFTVGPTGVIRTAAGLGVNVQIGGSLQFGGAMTLLNQGLISSQVSGRTITIPGSFTNAGTFEAINGGNFAVPLGYTQTAGVTRLSGGGTISALNGPATNTITISGGRLEGTGTIDANVVNSATISPGLSAGALPITGDLTLASSSTLEIELGGVIQGSNHDFLSEAGTAPLSLAGALTVTLTGGFVPAAADSLIILSSNQPITGMFSNLVGGRVLATDGITSLRVSVIGKHVVLAELPGDYNGNGRVDAADYVAWRKGLGGTFTHSHYDVWRANFGATAGAGNGSAVALAQNSRVPEPNAPALFLVGAAVMAGCRRRKRGPCRRSALRRAA